MKVCGVTGGRDRFDGAVCEWLTRQKPDLVIVGDATGVDQSARNWCGAHNVPMLEARAWWGFGKNAGKRRNQTIVDVLSQLDFRVGNEVILGAFPGGAGTRDCIRRARKAALTIEVVPEPPATYPSTPAPNNRTAT